MGSDIKHAQRTLRKLDHMIEAGIPPNKTKLPSVLVLICSPQKTPQTMEKPSSPPKSLEK